MVLLHVMAKEDDEERQFLYECRCTSSIDEIADDVLEISHLQHKIHTLCPRLRTHILTDDFQKNFVETALALHRVLSEAETYSSKDQVLHKRALSPRALKDHIQIIDKELKGAFSRGLITSDVLQIFPDQEPCESKQLWWAGKELKREKDLSHYIGQNEKTKILVRLKPDSSVVEEASIGSSVTSVFMKYEERASMTDKAYTAGLFDPEKQGRLEENISASPTDCCCFSKAYA